MASGREGKKRLIVLIPIPIPIPRRIPILIVDTQCPHAHVHQSGVANVTAAMRFTAVSLVHSSKEEKQKKKEMPIGIR